MFLFHHQYKSVWFGIDQSENLRLVDHHRHARLTVHRLGTVDPDRGSVVYGDLENELALLLGGLETRKDAAVWLDGDTRSSERGLDNRVILGKIVEINLVARAGRHNVRGKGEAVLTDLNVDGLGRGERQGREKDSAGGIHCEGGNVKCFE